MDKPDGTLHTGKTEFNMPRYADDPRLTAIKKVHEEISLKEFRYAELLQRDPSYLKQVAPVSREQAQAIRQGFEDAVDMLEENNMFELAVEARMIARLYDQYLPPSPQKKGKFKVNPMAPEQNSDEAAEAKTEQSQAKAGTAGEQFKANSGAQQKAAGSQTGQKKESQKEEPKAKKEEPKAKKEEPKAKKTESKKKPDTANSAGPKSTKEKNSSWSSRMGIPKIKKVFSKHGKNEETAAATAQKINSGKPDDLIFLSGLLNEKHLEDAQNTRKNMIIILSALKTHNLVEKDGTLTEDAQKELELYSVSNIMLLDENDIKILKQKLNIHPEDEQKALNDFKNNPDGRIPGKISVAKGKNHAYALFGKNISDGEGFTKDPYRDMEAVYIWSKTGELLTKIHNNSVKLTEKYNCMNRITGDYIDYMVYHATLDKKYKHNLLVEAQKLQLASYIHAAWPEGKEMTPENMKREFGEESFGKIKIVMLGREDAEDKALKKIMNGTYDMAYIRDQIDDQGRVLSNFYLKEERYQKLRHFKNKDWANTIDSMRGIYVAPFNRAKRTQAAPENDSGVA
jgi:hypothetical protein